MTKQASIPDDPALLDQTSHDQPTAFAATMSLGSTDPLFRASTEATILAPGTLADPASEPEKLGERYRFRDKLGAGGMGEVRVFKDHWIGRDIAWKTISGDLESSGSARARFLREIRIQGQLEHPSIVPVYDLGATPEGGLYFTMRRIKGLTLAAILEGLARGDEALAKRFSRRRLLTAFSSICMTIHYAHTRGVIHRDLKPNNVMLGDFGEVYVLDWGIAKIVGVEESIEDLAVDDVSTEQGHVIGTLGYMAPEQALGKTQSLDARTDVYSLGVILFEILTLEHLLEKVSPIRALERIIDGVDARPSQRKGGADVAPELEAICVRATAKDAEDRYPSAQMLVDAVERFLDGDRDLERRRELARGYGTKAEELAERALSASVGAAEAEEARADALKEALHALALFPDQPEAQRTFARIALEAPREMPPAAAAERAAVRRFERVEGALLASRAYLAYLLAFPLMVWMGVRSWPAVGTGLVLTLVTAAVARRIYKTRSSSHAGFILLFVLSSLAIMVQGTWLGPFVLVPTATAITTGCFALYAEKRERLVVVLGGAALILVSFLPEILPFVPHAFSFEPGKLILHERALVLSPVLTTIGLLYVCVGYVILPAIFLFRLRDTLSVAEDRLFLQAWYMKRLFPAVTGSAVAS